MPSLFSSSVLASLLLAGSALASPALAPTPVLAARKDATTSSTASLEPTDAWVSVGTDGNAATTVTPLLTTIDGVATVISASPTTKPLLHTTTTTTEQPHAYATSGAGAFPVCSNTDGENAPFCAPDAGSLLRPGNTYYITWDPTFFADYPLNTTLTVTGKLYDVDSGELTDNTAFSSPPLAAATKSFYAWTVPSSILSNVKNHADGVNVSISMSFTNSDQQNSTAQGPVINAANPPQYSGEPRHAAKGAALYIGLPVIFGFILIMVAGTCMWNRHRRRLGLGNVMSRHRFGELVHPKGFRKGYGIRKSRRERVGDNGLGGAISLDSKDAIQLQSRGVDYRYSEEDDEEHAGGSYRDTPTTGGLSIDPSRANRSRRDSDALGSLAGTPTDERFGQSSGGPSGSTGNAFRDELARQERMG